jgi:hypothetical protein
LDGAALLTQGPAYLDGYTKVERFSMWIETERHTMTKPEQPPATPPVRPLAEQIAALQREADKLGPADPDFDPKTFSDKMWGE